MEQKPVFKRINFVKRYHEICANHNDFENRMRGNNKKMYLEKLKKLDNSVIYYANDKMFKVSYKKDIYSIDLGLSIHDGLVEARLFYIINDNWIIYNRFDFLALELDESYDRDNYNIPSYTSNEELEVILTEIFSIYEDIKKEFLKESLS